MRNNKILVNFLKIVVLVGALLTASTLMYCSVCTKSESHTKQFPLKSKLKPQYSNTSPLQTQQTITQPQSGQFKIPNIVNFVYAVDNTSDPVLLQFSDWLAVHSAVMHQKPDLIYLHTNSLVTSTLQRSTLSRASHIGYPSYWTWLILNAYPQLTVKFMDPPRTTRRGLFVTRIQNYSDFFRTLAMKLYGGIYMDFDSYLIKNLDPLRESGFGTVVGFQSDSRIACGFWLGAPNSTFGTLYHGLQSDAFDGRWDTHAVSLMDWIVREVMKLPNSDKEVLVLHKNAFFPFGWSKNDLNELYGAFSQQTSIDKPQVNQKLDMPDIDFGSITDSEAQQQVKAIAEKFISTFPPTQVVDGREIGKVNRLLSSIARKQKGQIQLADFSKTYAIHGFRSALHKYLLSGEVAFGDEGAITPQYILSQQSNFAIAVYPVLRNAIDLDLVDFKVDNSWSF